MDRPRRPTAPRVHRPFLYTAAISLCTCAGGGHFPLVRPPPPPPLSAPGVSPTLSAAGQRYDGIRRRRRLCPVRCMKRRRRRKRRGRRETGTTCAVAVDLSLSSLLSLLCCVAPTPTLTGAHTHAIASRSDILRAASRRSEGEEPDGETGLLGAVFFLRFFFPLRRCRRRLWRCAQRPRPLPALHRLL